MEKMTRELLMKLLGKIELKAKSIIRNTDIY